MSSIELAEKLKRKLTDQWVVVDPSVPELRRFQKRTGRVKTVNMNGRALVQFDGPADLGWYDIDPAFLTVVDGPTRSSHQAASKTDQHGPLPTKPAKSGTGTGAAAISPLDLVRQQQGTLSAAKSPPAAAPSKPVPGTKPTASALDQNPWQAPHVLASEAVPEASPVTPAATLSPLERIRRQQAAKAGGIVATTATSTVRPATSLDQNPWQAAHVVSAEAGPSAESLPSPAMSPLEQIRRQQAAKADVSASTKVSEFEQNPWQAPHVVASESTVNAASVPVATASANVASASAASASSLDQNPWQAAHVVAAEMSIEAPVVQEPVKPLSPIEQIRRQQAAKQAGTGSPATTTAASSAPAALPSTAAAPAAKLSPIEQIRQQQRAKQLGSEVGGSAATTSVTPDEPKLSPIEIVRRQQAAKKKT